MILKKLTSTFLIASLFSINISYADNMAEEKSKAIKTLENYAKSIACDVEITKNPILLDYQPESEASSKEVMFLVQWSGDGGCLGGSATYSINLNYVYYNPNAEYQYLIGPDFINEIHTLDTGYSINSRFIESVKLNEQHQIEIIAGELGDEDSFNFPSKYFKYTVSLDSPTQILKREFDHDAESSN